MLQESELCIPPSGSFRGYAPQSFLSRDHTGSSYVFLDVIVNGCMFDNVDGDLSDHNIEKISGLF